MTAHHQTVVGGAGNRRPYFFFRIIHKVWDERCERLITDFPYLLAAYSVLFNKQIFNVCKDPRIQSVINTIHARRQALMLRHILR